MPAPAALAMLGTSVPAEEAERMGMIWQVVDDAALMDEATKLARNARRRPDAAPTPPSSRR